jgi:hypothetical protein
MMVVMKKACDPWEIQSEGILLARSLMPAVVRKLGQLLKQEGVSDDVKVKVANTLARIAETDRSRIV